MADYSEQQERLGLVVRSAPWSGRCNREQLDFALAAAALGIELEMVFLGEGLHQLLAAREGNAEAGLPAGHKGWAALSGMTEVSACGENSALQQLADAGHEFLIPLQGLDRGAMSARLKACQRVLVL